MVQQTHGIDGGTQRTSNPFFHLFGKGEEAEKSQECADQLWVLDSHEQDNGVDLEVKGNLIIQFSTQVSLELTFLSQCSYGFYSKTLKGQDELEHKSKPWLANSATGIILLFVFVEILLSDHSVLDDFSPSSALQELIHACVRL